MAQPGKVLARGLFIFIMLVLEKLWKPASLCLRMVWFFCLGVEGICVHLCVIVPVMQQSAYRDGGPALRPADGLLSIVDRLTWWK